ncbi:efflux RND transporter periplasmic adaptor subunit [Planctomyces sp. SH-PL62]|uniref:efflux RND transporter periplasmic adaptor subunit n=1 Tax=Planctomyces sp. SH-PL62 TaxID=1636152 RepID=UPI00078E9465|nr:efflux RND transporter periplasmic adaptor subunit [Planctomyces sp. SH-PL62]AMV37061.1 Multidrug resistance protein MdtA precursor [Planctomyces sp. SH-PL62]
MASSLREELASLRIERANAPRPTVDRASATESRPGTSTEYRRRKGVGLRLVSLLFWLIPLGVIGAAGAVGYKQYDQMRSKPEVTIGLVQQMTLGEAEKLLSSKGYLKSRYQAMIGTRIAGRVEEMRVTERASVKKGEILAVIEHHDMDAMLLQRKAALLKAEADLEEAKVDLWDKERQEKRLGRLFEKSMTPQEDYDKALAARRGAEARIAATEAAIQMTRSNIDEIEATIHHQMYLYAPFDGTVVEKQGEVGEIISPMAMSSSLGRSAVVTIADLRNMDVEADIPEEQMYRVTEGQPAEISVTAVPSKRYRGRLRQITPMGDRTRATVKVKVEILDPDDKLFPELAATVHFLPDKKFAESEASRAFLYVPTEAVFQENGHDWVWLMDRDSRLSRRKIEVANSNRGSTRVESGLQADDKVVLNPTSGLRDGAVVREAAR